MTTERRIRPVFLILAVLVFGVLHSGGEVMAQDCNGNGIPDAQELGERPPFDDYGRGYWRFESFEASGVPNASAGGVPARMIGAVSPVTTPPTTSVLRAGFANAHAVALTSTLEAVCDANTPTACGSGPCCEANGTPGCADPGCCATVCAADPFCCDTDWDDSCAVEAQGRCGGDGHFEIDDVDGAFSFGNQSFTIEAWVRLDALGTPTDNQSKQWLVQKKPVPGGDAELDYGFLVQAGELGTSGRELVGRFGAGGGTVNVVSTLTIEDFDWHYVAMVYDRAAGKLRFQVDDQVDSRDFQKPNTVNDGPVWIGAHVSGSNTTNQRLRGAIDEIRISAIAVPRRDRLNAFPVGGDCDGNGRPDDCDRADGARDCDANGQLDACDIADGLVDDCQGDGVPDSCQTLPIGDDAHHDGESDAAAMSDGSHTAWFEYFRVQEGREAISGVGTRFGSSALGNDLTVHVWSDPNQDGDPTDAVPLCTVEYTIEQDDTDLVIDLPLTRPGPPGTGYFIGFVSVGPILFPAACDFDPPYEVGTSWIVGANEQIDPADLSANAVEFTTLDAGGFSDGVNWLITAKIGPFPGDCDDNGVPDDCDIAAGLAEDCQGDGIPDQCQLGSDAVVFGYANGLVQGDFGLQQPGGLAWFSEFRTQRDQVTLERLEIRRADLPPGEPITVCIWRDPDGDGEPSDAVLAARLDTTVPADDLGVFELPPVLIEDAGASFFAGAIVWDPNGAFEPAALDGENPRRRGWLVVDLDGPVDPVDLTDGAEYVGLIDEWSLGPGVPLVANFFIDVFGTSAIPDNDDDGDGIPNECDIACPADFNGDGLVNGVDLGGLISAWGTVAPDFDLDGDGVVSGGDLGQLFAAWGPCL